MDINPFEILKNAQKIQERMGDLQERLGNITATGAAGGGMTEVELNGRFEVIAIRIAPEAVDPRDIEMLQDLVKAAFRDASEKIREALKGEMGSLAGGMGLPPGFAGM